MLCNKLVLIAATAALAFGSINASQQGNVHLRVHAEKANCPPGQSPMSVEGVAGVFYTSDKACAGHEGSCPGPQAGLPNGAFCGTVQSGVRGCKPKSFAWHHQ